MFSKGSSVYPTSKKYRLILIFSISLLVFAVVGVIFQVCSITVGGKYSLVSTGIWSGLLYGATGITGLLSIRKTYSSKLNWAVCGLASLSSIASIVLIALSALGLGDNSLTDNTQESLLLLWTVSNAILIAIGVAALVVSVIFAVVSPMSYSNPNVEIEEMSEKSIESNYTSLPKYPPSDVVAIVKPVNGAGHDLYEILEKPKQSDINKKDSETYALPWSIPVKTSTNNSDDFEIQVDNTQDIPIKRNFSYFQNDWLTAPPVNNKKTDSETQDEEGWKTIQVPKEDIVVHAPSSPNQRDHHSQHGQENGDILRNR